MPKPSRNGDNGKMDSGLKAQQELAKIEERQRYTEMLDANFQLIQAQLNLLRSIGGVEEWALQAPRR